MRVAITSIREGHQGAIYDLCKVGDKVATTGGDNRIILWDIANPNDGAVIAQTLSTCYAIAYHDPYLYLGERGGRLHCLSIHDKIPIHNNHLHLGDIFEINVFNDKVIALSADGSFSVWSPDLKILIYHQNISTKSLRKVIYNTFNREFVIASSDGKLYILDNENYQIKMKVEAHKDSVFSLASLSNDAIMSGGKDAQLIVWDASAYKPLRAIPAHLQTINDIALHPNANIVATAGRDKCVKLWSYPDMALLKVLDAKFPNAHHHSVNTLTWLDATHLLTAGDDKRIIEWNIGDY